MDRRVLLAALVLFAGGATGVGVAVFAFVGVDGATAEASVVWESDAVAGDDGTGTASITVDGTTLLVQPTTVNDTRSIRAVEPGAGAQWTTAVVPRATPEASGGTRAPRGSVTTGRLDGDPVVATTTEDGRLLVLDAVDGRERFSVELGGSSGVAPAIGDPTGDGTNVVAAATADGRVVVVDADGSRRFEATVDGSVERRPLIVGPNPDPDGRETGIAGGIAVSTAGSDTGMITLFGASGTPLWERTPTVTPVSWTAASTRRGPVIALGGANGNLEAVEVADGSTRYEVGLQDRPVAVGGLDAGRVLVGGVGSVWAVDLLDGEVVWKQQYGGETRVNAPGVGDVANDRTPEVVAVNRKGALLGLNRNGEPVLRGGLDGTDGAPVVYAGPLVADTDGDGTDEVVVVDETGRARVLSS
jgi:hypothetical protein